MIRARTNRTLLSLALLSVVMLAIAVAPAGAFGAAAVATNGGTLAGFGFWDTLACVGCIAGFVAGAGTTIAGFAVFVAANPELGILCVSSCAAAV